MYWYDIVVCCLNYITLITLNIVVLLFKAD
jgi:hypothetical protein